MKKNDMLILGSLNNLSYNTKKVANTFSQDFFAVNKNNIDYKNNFWKKLI